MKKKRLFAVLPALLMCLLLVPTTALAAEACFEEDGLHIVGDGIVATHGEGVFRVDGNVLCSLTDEERFALHTESNLVREPTPTATFSATDESSGILSGVESGMTYQIDRNALRSDVESGVHPIGLSAPVAIVDDHVLLSNLNPCKIYVVKTGQADTIHSEAQIITVTRAAVPTCVEKTNCTTAANNDGSLIGVSPAMEYRKDGGQWINCTANTVSDLDSGAYDVRVKAAGSVLASEVKTLTIAAFAPDITDEVHFTAAEIAAMSDKKTLTLGDGIRMIVDAETLQAVSGGSAAVAVKAKQRSLEELTAVQRAEIEKKSSDCAALVYEFILEKDGAPYQGRFLAPIDVTVWVGQPAENSRFCAYWLNGDRLETVFADYDALAQTNTMHLSHFSSYVLLEEALPADDSGDDTICSAVTYDAGFARYALISLSTAAGVACLISKGKVLHGTTG